MKYISLILIMAVTLTLSGCFSKSEEANTGSGVELEQEEELSEDMNLQEETLDDQTDANQIDEIDSQDDQSTSQEVVEPSDTETNNETSASGSIETQELESYEDDLEDLFKDILGELDSEKSE